MEGERNSQLLVVKGDGPSLLGRDWLSELRLGWGAIHNVCVQIHLETILDDHSELFKDELGLIRGVKAKIHVGQQAHPCFCKPRAVPFSLRKGVELELNGWRKKESLSQCSSQSGLPP